MEITEIEQRVARGDMSAAQVFTQMRQHIGNHKLPERLTAENGAKAVLMGEFYERVEQTCLDCLYEGREFECERCGGNGFIHVNVPVSWTTIKSIYERVVKHFSVAPNAHSTPKAGCNTVQSHGDNAHEPPQNAARPSDGD